LPPDTTKMISSLSSVCWYSKLWISVESAKGRREVQEGQRAGGASRPGSGGAHRCGGRGGGRRAPAPAAAGAPAGTRGASRGASRRPRCWARRP
jgi:hypothetical protein